MHTREEVSSIPSTSHGAIPEFVEHASQKMPLHMQHTCDCGVSGSGKCCWQRMHIVEPSTGGRALLLVVAVKYRLGLHDSIPSSLQARDQLGGAGGGGRRRGCEKGLVSNAIHLPSATITLAQGTVIIRYNVECSTAVRIFRRPKFRDERRAIWMLTR